jgi:hypothetical protein
VLAATSPQRQQERAPAGAAGSYAVAEQRATRLAQLSRKARRQQATPEELAELERLEEQSAPQAP